MSVERSPLTILVVDDTPENLHVVGELLEPHYRVRVANSGTRALQIVGVDPRPDLILLDVMMPELDGYQVLQALRNDPLTAAIPVIFLTGLDSAEDEEHGLSLGAVDYITKPIRPAIVLARVRAQMDLKRARDLLQEHNNFLEEEVNRRMEENQIIQDVSVRALANLAEIRDPETGNHIRRTQIYVELLARHMSLLPAYAEKLTPTYISLLSKAAPLHDIGKVGIPDHILLKPGRLTPDEFTIMQRHSKFGADAIEQAWGGTLAEISGRNLPPRRGKAHPDARMSMPFLDLAKEIARHHHEKWDGSGYPDGLAGEEIPLSARIMALADVFDALISRRLYKPPFAIEDVTRIIAEGRGQHFQPELVDIFMAAREEFQAVAQQYADDEQQILDKLQTLHLAGAGLGEKSV